MLKSLGNSSFNYLIFYTKLSLTSHFIFKFYVISLTKVKFLMESQKHYGGGPDQRNSNDELGLSRPPLLV